MNDDRLKSFILGTAQLGTGYGVANKTGRQSEGECIDLLKFAWEKGVRILDTAEGYGDGLSESMIGAYHKRYPNQGFSVCSKLSSDISPDQVFNHISESLERLFCQRIDLYYLHSFSMCRDSEILNNLGSAKQQGLIRQIGISIYAPDELEYIADNLCDFVDVVQIPFNVFDCSRWISAPALEKARSGGLKLFVRSVYLQGMVFKSSEDDGVKRLGLSDAVKEFDRIARDINVSKAQAALDFVKDTRAVSAIILGCETAQQVGQNANMMREQSKWTPNARERMLDISSQIPTRAVDPRTWN